MTGSGKRAALISVYDKAGILPLARSLAAADYVLLSTGGSEQYLRDNGIEVLSVSEYTGQREVMDGRVKTLHPKIHGGILARRDVMEDRIEIEREGIFLIDFVIVNLYPFLDHYHGGERDLQKLRSLIDIGGPTMLRAAAKNYPSVLPLIDEKDYQRVIESLDNKTSNDCNSIFSTEFRRECAAKVFLATAKLDAAIAESLIDGSTMSNTKQDITSFTNENYILHSKLRYGENPQQEGAFFTRREDGPLEWKLLQGKPLSYNNVLDLSAVSSLIKAFPPLSDGLYGAVIVKHSNPCGAAVHSAKLDALEQAKLGDPRSHFGGVTGFNFEVDHEIASNIASEFAEVVVAPKFTEEALSILYRKSALRVIEYPNISISAPQVEVRSVLGGLLVQEGDAIDYKRVYREVHEAKVVAGPQPDEETIKALILGWGIVARVSSNAIVLVRDTHLIGVGAGQMSRIDSVELAVSKASRHGHDLKGSVAASDAFFPFPDSVEYLGLNGIKAIIAPGGAKRDDEIILSANKYGISLLFTDYRHFRH